MLIEVFWQRLPAIGAALSLCDASEDFLAVELAAS